MRRPERRLHVASIALLGVVASGLATFLAACADDRSDDVTDGTATSSGLAPSQVTASTVAAPAVPGLCDPSAITAVTDVTAEGLARVVLSNGGDVECEIDLTGTPALDPDAEPTVWLVPGAAAELSVGGADASCDAPVASTDLMMGGVPMAVDVSTIGVCAVAFVAFFPL